MTWLSKIQCDLCGSEFDAHVNGQGTFTCYPVSGVERWDLCPECVGRITEFLQVAAEKMRPNVRSIGETKP